VLSVRLALSSGHYHGGEVTIAADRLPRGPVGDPAGSGLPSTPSAQHTHRAGYGGHTTNMPIEDMLETPTWIALAHGGPSIRPKTPARALGPVARVDSA
jgi:hypothetical protein